MKAKAKKQITAEAVNKQSFPASIFQMVLEGVTCNVVRRGQTVKSPNDPDKTEKAEDVYLYLANEGKYACRVSLSELKKLLYAVQVEREGK